MDNEKIQDRTELGSLARESEKVRLTQEHLNVPALPPQGSRLAVAAASDNVMSVTLSSKHKYQVLPCGLWLAALLAAICFVGGNVQVSRAMLLSELASRLEASIGTETWMQVQEDLAQSLQANNQYGAAQARYKMFIEQLVSRYGAHDRRVSLAQLELASSYLNAGNESSARTIWTEQLKILNKPASGTAPALTAALQKLASRYDDLNDKLTARALYLETLRQWYNAPGNGTISNIESDTAEIDERLGNYKEANQYYRKAFDYSTRFGKAPFNVYRLWQIGYTYNQLGKYKDAVPYLQKALAMQAQVGWPESFALSDLQGELAIAKAGFAGKKDRRIPGRYLPDTQYKLSQDVYELWTRGSQLQEQGKYKEAAQYLGEAVKLSAQVGWPTGPQLSRLYDEMGKARENSMRQGQKE